MYAQVEKSKENKSKAVANSVVQRKKNIKRDLEFIDNRPEANFQRKLINTINSSTQVKHSNLLSTKNLQFKSKENQTSKKISNDRVNWVTQLQANQNEIVQFTLWDTVRNWFSGDHRYENFTPVRTLTTHEQDNPAPILQQAYQSLRNHAAPGAHGMEVTEEESGTDLAVTFLGTVNSVADNESLSLINTTQEDHMLHPGTVHRQVIQRDNVIGIRSIGLGNGLFPTFNTWFTPVVWRPVDNQIRLDINVGAREQQEVETEAAYERSLI